MKRYLVTLTDEERRGLEQLIRAGQGAARKLARARILLKADCGSGGPDWDDATIAESLEVGIATVERARKQFVEEGLEAALEALVDPVTRGDPESPLRWTCKGTRRLASQLQKQGYAVSHTLVVRLLRESGYRLQANRKTREGTSHPDRDGQFAYINQQVTRQIKRGQPVISVDTKKKGN